MNYYGLYFYRSTGVGQNEDQWHGKIYDTIAEKADRVAFYQRPVDHQSEESSRGDSFTRKGFLFNLGPFHIIANSKQSRYIRFLLLSFIFSIWLTMFLNFIRNINLACFSKFKLTCQTTSNKCLLALYAGINDTKNFKHFLMGISQVTRVIHPATYLLCSAPVLTQQRLEFASTSAPNLSCFTLFT
jgi:hypothetical protein